MEDVNRGVKLKPKQAAYAAAAEEREAAENAAAAAQDMPEAHVSFHGTVLAETSRGRRTAGAQTTTREGPVPADVVSQSRHLPPTAHLRVHDHTHAVWTGAKVPTLQAVVGFAAAMAHERLIFAVRTGAAVREGANDELGHGSLSLERAARGEDGWTFVVPLLRGSRLRGWLQGRVDLAYDAPAGLCMPGRGSGGDAP